ncbi:hypothetical protein RLEG12_06245 (plasmid) [Rhizobium leguminosarum bv. trifolii CB782]|nr:hypothetical protein RLEG12_06245 [Rhizobium leguminosarum bv. trifolii CB782]
MRDLIPVMMDEGGARRFTVIACGWIGMALSADNLRCAVDRF